MKMLHKFYNWLTGRDIRTGIDAIIELNIRMHSDIRMHRNELYVIHNLTQRLKASRMVLEAALSANRKEDSHEPTPPTVGRAGCQDHSGGSCGCRMDQR